MGGAPGCQRLRLDRDRVQPSARRTGNGPAVALLCVPGHGVSMNPHYRHTQVGWVIIGSIAAALVLVIPIVTVPAAPEGALLIGGILLLAGLLFSALTVTVDAEELRVSFTFGLVSRRVALADIREVRVVRNPWHYGWGVHRIPGGWIWNASGWYAVALELRDGRALRVGTDEPEALLRAIEMVAPSIGQPLDAHGMPIEHARRRSWLAVGAVAAIATGALLFMTLVYFQTRPPKVTVTEESITIDNLFYGDEYPMAEVNGVSLETRLPRIRARTNGFSGGGVHRGWYVVDGLGKAKLFVDLGYAPYLVLQTRRGFVVVNFADPHKTRALYREIEKKRQR